MSTGDIILDILYDIAINIGADELRDFLRKILTGEDVEQLVASGDPTAKYVRTAFADAGIDADAFSDQQWAQVDALTVAGLEDGFDELRNGTGDLGFNDLSDPTG